MIADRQGDAEDAASAGRSVDPDPTAMHLDHRPAQGETQSVALDSAAIRGWRTGEALENALAVRAGDSGSIVADSKCGFAWTSLEAHVHVAAVLTAVLARVGDQVQERATEHLRIDDPSHRLPRELETQHLALAIGDRFHRARRPFRHITQIALGQA